MVTGERCILTVHGRQLRCSGRCSRAEVKQLSTITTMKLCKTSGQLLMSRLIWWYIADVVSWTRAFGQQYQFISVWECTFSACWSSTFVVTSLVAWYVSLSSCRCSVNKSAGSRLLALSLEMYSRVCNQVRKGHRAIWPIRAVGLRMPKPFHLQLSSPNLMTARGNQMCLAFEIDRL